MVETLSEPSVGERGVLGASGANDVSRRRRRRRRNLRRDAVVLVLVLVALGGLGAGWMWTKRYPRLDVPMALASPGPGLAKAMADQTFMVWQAASPVGAATLVGADGGHNFYLAARPAVEGDLKVGDANEAKPATVLFTDDRLGIVLIETALQPGPTPPRLRAARPPIGSVVFISSISTTQRKPLRTVTTTRVLGPTNDVTAVDRSVVAAGGSGVASKAADPSAGNGIGTSSVDMSVEMSVDTAAASSDADLSAEPAAWVALESDLVGRVGGGPVFDVEGALVGIVVKAGRFVPTAALTSFARKSGRFVVEKPAKKPATATATSMTTMTTTTMSVPLIPAHLPSLPSVEGQPSFAVTHSPTATVLLTSAQVGPNAVVAAGGETLRVVRRRSVPPHGTLLAVQRSLAPSSAVEHDKQMAPGTIATISGKDGVISALAVAAYDPGMGGVDSIIFLDGTAADAVVEGVVRDVEGDVIGTIAGRDADGLLAVTRLSTVVALAAPQVQSHLVEVDCSAQCNVWSALLLDDLLDNIATVELLAHADMERGGYLRYEVIGARAIGHGVATVVSGYLAGAKDTVTVGLRFGLARGAVIKPVPNMELLRRERKFTQVVSLTGKSDEPILNAELQRRRMDVELCRVMPKHCAASCEVEGRTADCVRHGYQLKDSDPVRAVELWQRACGFFNDEGCVAFGEAYWDGRGLSKDALRAIEVWADGCTYCGVQSCIVGAGWLNHANMPDEEHFNDKACRRGQREACEHKVLKPEALRRRWETISSGRSLR